MQAQLPATLNFIRQVERNYRFDGEVSLSRLPRLCELLVTPRGNVQVRLEFGDSVGYAGLKGTVSARLEQECQRCLQPVTTEISSHFRFAFIHDEAEEAQIPDEFEAYLIEGEEQSLIDLLEDELLLSLPMVSMHREPCSEFMREQALARQAEKEATHPFAALKALKK